jgi:integrase
MATLATDKGTYRIQWQDNGSRQSISLSAKKFSKRTATDLREIVQELLYYRDNSIETQSKRNKIWIESTSPIIRQKLANVGLLAIPEKHTCGELWKSYLLSKRNNKEKTISNYQAAQKQFLAFFNEKTLITTIKKDNIEKWKQHLINNDYAEASIAGYGSKTSFAFKWAVEQKWITSNPCSGVQFGSFVNRANDFFVTIDEYERLISLSKDQEWRLLLTLARIGGLRCPSEAAALQWEDIDWQKNRFYVRASKTEHIAGHEGRVPPLFTRLKKELIKWQPQSKTNKVFDKTPEELMYLYRSTLEQHGVTIPRPFDNMRASRSTEIFSQFGEYLESIWIGHSKKIACKHYLMVRDEDYAKVLANKKFV